MVSGRRLDPVEFHCIVCGKASETYGSRAPKFCGSRCRDRERYQRERGKRIEAARRYRSENRETIAQRRRTAWAEDHEKGRKANRESYLRHRESRIRDACAYQRANPNVVARTRNRRRSTQSFSVTSRDLSRLLTRSEGRCAYCGVLVESPGRENDNSMQYDHRVPLSRGGVDGIGNLEISCRKCNLRKNRRTVMEFRMAIEDAEK